MKKDTPYLKLENMKTEADFEYIKTRLDLGNGLGKSSDRAVAVWIITHQSLADYILKGQTGEAYRFDN